MLLGSNQTFMSWDLVGGKISLGHDDDYRDGVREEEGAAFLLSLFAS